MTENTTRPLRTLSSTGIITIADLAVFAGTSPQAVITALRKNDIRILKLSKFHTAWLVRLEDLK